MTVTIQTEKARTAVAECVNLFYKLVSATRDPRPLPSPYDEAARGFRNNQGSVETALLRLKQLAGWFPDGVAIVGEPYLSQLLDADRHVVNDYDLDEAAAVLLDNPGLFED